MNIVDAFNKAEWHHKIFEAGKLIFQVLPIGFPKQSLLSV